MGQLKLITILSLIAVNLQGQEIIWQNSLGGSLKEFAYGLAETNLGYVLVHTQRFDCLN